MSWTFIRSPDAVCGVRRTRNKLIATENARPFSPANCFEANFIGNFISVCPLSAK